MPDRKQPVLVVFGGRSAEHEISILSARFVVASLDPERFEPLLCAIDKRGRWHWLAELPTGDARTVRIDERAPAAALVPADSDRPFALIDGSGARHAFDVAFPVLHGPYGEDGTIQGLFEMYGIPYVGSGVSASALGMDKVQQKRIFERVELPVLPYCSFFTDSYARFPEETLAECRALGFPLFVKPANMGSSLGVSKVRSEAELGPAIARALELDTTVLVERGLPAPREIEIALLGDESRQRAADPGEIVVEHRDGFYSYDAKYLDADGARLVLPADLTLLERAVATGLAGKAFRALGCTGLARVDLFFADGEWYLNEVNTMPGFTEISMYPRMWANSGVGGRELVTRLIELGCERHARRAALCTSR